MLIKNTIASYIQCGGWRELRNVAMIFSPRGHRKKTGGANILLVLELSDVIINLATQMNLLV